MLEPKVTIAIPTYNRAHLLRRSLESALNQSYTNLEVVVSDDGSTDTTLEVIREYTDPRLRVIAHSHNRGLFLNLNACLEAATGELFLLLSDDDYLERDCISRLIEPWHDTTGLVMSYGQYWVHGESGRTLFSSLGPSAEDGVDYVYGWWEEKRATILHGSLFRTADLVRVGAFPHIYAQDTWVQLRIAFEGKVAHVGHPVTNYQLQPSSTTHMLNLSVLLGEKQALLEMCQEQLRRFGVDADRRQKLEDMAGKSLALAACAGLVRNRQLGPLKSMITALPDLWPYLRHRPFLAMAAIVAGTIFPPSLLESLRPAARTVKSFIK